MIKILTWLFIHIRQLSFKLLPDRAWRLSSQLLDFRNWFSFSDEGVRYSSTQLLFILTSLQQHLTALLQLHHFTAMLRKTVRNTNDWFSLTTTNCAHAYTMNKLVFVSIRKGSFSWATLRLGMSPRYTGEKLMVRDGTFFVKMFMGKSSLQLVFRDKFSMIALAFQLLWDAHLKVTTSKNWSNLPVMSLWWACNVLRVWYVRCVQINSYRSVRLHDTSVYIDKHNSYYK